MPAPIKWEQTAEKDTINDLKILTEKSTCQCAVGGKISVTHKGHNEQHENRIKKLYFCNFFVYLQR